MKKTNPKRKKDKVNAKKKMSVTNYPIGDFLIRVKNTAMARGREVSANNTKLIKAVAQALKKEGFLEEVSEENGKIVVILAYRRKEPVIMDLKIISRPGIRVYASVDDLEKKRGPSLYILSTSSGIKSSKEAIKLRKGGEIITEIW